MPISALDLMMHRLLGMPVAYGPRGLGPPPAGPGLPPFGPGPGSTDPGGSRPGTGPGETGGTDIGNLPGAIMHPGRWLGSGADWRNTWSDWGFGGPSNAALREHLSQIDQGPAQDAARRQQLYNMFKRGARQGKLTFEDVVYGPRADPTTASGMAPGGHYLMALLGNRSIYDAPFGTPGTNPLRYFSEKKINRLRRIEDRKGGAR